MILSLVMSAVVISAQPSTRDVVRRMAAYVDAYGDKASAVVATERYSQREVNDAAGSNERDLVSDFAIVRTEERRWVGFRDVLEADGKRIEDRENRLMDLLTSGGFDEARRLTQESARFNVGPVVRDFNVPTAALFFFTSENLDRFKFKTKGTGGAGVWAIDFQETHTPTLVRTPEGDSIRATGTVWVNEADGAIVRTLLDLHVINRKLPDAVALTVNVDVKYQRVAALDMWLPAVMTETYDSKERSVTDRVATRADYSNYRTFQTSGRIK
jgi:hypothetical protein